MMAMTVKPRDSPERGAEGGGLAWETTGSVGVELGREDHRQDGGAERAADLLGDPGDGTGVGYLLGSEPEVGGGHDRDGDAPSPCRSSWNRRDDLG